MTPEEIQDAVAQRVATEKQAAASRTEQPPGSSKPEITPEFVWQCYKLVEVGDGLLFCAIHRGRFIHNCDTKDEWYFFNGVHWQIDKKAARAQNAVEDVVSFFEIELGKLIERKKEAEIKEEEKLAAKLYKQIDALKSRIRNLRKVRGRRTCLEAATTCENPLICSYSDLDQNPMLLACANGVIDLRTGIMRPGRPEDMITRAAQVPFPLDVDLVDEQTIKCPTWRKFLWDCLEDQETIDYLLLVLGYSITGLVTERIFMVFWGPHGFSGKGTYMKTIRYIMGDLAAPIRTEMLIAQKNPKSADGPSPSTMSMKGRRFIWASEVEENQRFATGIVKLMTGDDEMVGRAPNDRHETYFEPVHTLYLICNDKLHASTNDDAFWGRQRLIEWPFSFVLEREPKQKWEKKGDSSLKNKLREEAPYILALAVRKCLLWQKNGLHTPKKIATATAEYRRSEDLLQDFIDECLILDPNCSEGSSDIYDVFKRWWPANIPNAKTLSVRKFGDLMTVKFDKEKPKGLVVYLGVRLNNNSRYRYAPFKKED